MLFTSFRSNSKAERKERGIHIYAMYMYHDALYGAPTVLVSKFVNFTSTMSYIMIMFPIPEHTRESAAKSASSGRGREEAGRVAKGERTSAYHCVCVSPGTASTPPTHSFVELSSRLTAGV